MAFACPLSAFGQFICQCTADVLRVKIGIGLNNCRKSCSRIDLGLVPSFLNLHFFWIKPVLNCIKRSALFLRGALIL
jgi:hypothetical protein